MRRPEPPPDRRALGREFEVSARSFLEARGMVCHDANWQCRLGELDLVMQAGQVLVFVEVRARRPGNPVRAIDSIDAGKRRRIVAAARHWLMHHPHHASLPARFDIVAFDGPTHDSEPTWLVDAFDVAPR